MNFINLLHFGTALWKQHRSAEECERERERLKFKEKYIFRINRRSVDRRTTEIVTHSTKKDWQKQKMEWHFCQHLWNTIETSRTFCSTSSFGPNYVCRISYVSSVLNICQSSHGFGNARHDGVKIPWCAKCIHDHGAYAFVSRLIIIINIPIWRKWDEEKHKCVRTHYTRAHTTARSYTYIFYFYRQRQWKTASTSAQHRKTKRIFMAFVSTE